VTLTNRVSAFFLGWLALALVGFAVAVFLVVRVDLYGQADRRLEGTLNTLAAAAEIDASGIEWEPLQRDLPRSGSGPQWLIVDPQGTIIDRSGSDADWLLDEALRPPHRRAITTIEDGNDEHWRIARRSLVNNRPDTPADIKLGELRYASLELIAAIPVQPIDRRLAQLAGWLFVLTVGLWLTGALVGRWLCRRTLRPVAKMAASAGQLSPSASSERLIVQPTGDELEDLGRAFNGALDRLEEALDRQRRFTGDAAHQLRTPLAAMLGQVEVALRRDRTEAEYRDTLQAVAGEIRHLHRLTESLLFLARADAEAVRPELQQINLAVWLNARLEGWRAQHSKAHIELIDATSASPIVQAHSELLAQLVENLIDNAVKYGAAGSPVIVRIAARQAGVDLSVEDSGPGIASEDLPHIFDPFYRSAEARKAGVRGVGLGLAIAKRIATALGATLTAESVVGHGTRLVVQFAPVSA
jgi:two-component system, OmpR family, sensor kinase